MATILGIVKNREFIRDQLWIAMDGYDCPNQWAVIGLL